MEGLRINHVRTSIENINQGENNYKLSGNIVITNNFIGTKCLVAQWANQYQGIGQDIVNININDILSLNAIPLTVSMGLSILRDTDLHIIEEISEGIAEATHQNNIVFLPGKIAHLPEILKPEFKGRSFNVHSFGIGISHSNFDEVELKKGDAIIGIRSSGIHCNGYSLVRKALIDQWISVNHFSGYKAGDIFIPTNKTIENELLTPTLSYFPLIKAIIKNNFQVKGITHVTKGGVTSLMKYITNDNIGIDIHTFPQPPQIFSEIMKIGNVNIGEMFRVFNMGIGFYLIIDPSIVDNIITLSNEIGFTAVEIGKIVSNHQGISLKYGDNEIIYQNSNKWEIIK